MTSNASPASMYDDAGESVLEEEFAGAQSLWLARALLKATPLKRGVRRHKGRAAILTSEDAAD